MYLLDALLPKSCAFCGVQCGPEENSLCRQCREDLPWSEPALSPSPGRLRQSFALLHYSFPVDVAIKSLKFSRKLYYAPAFAEILAAAAPQLDTDIDYLLPVPLHWRRKALRGFNQAEEIAKPLARQLKTPLLRGVVRRRHTPFQSGLDADARKRNIRGAFAVSKALHAEHILIVDDVMTTGATVSELAAALFRQGVRRVSTLVLARAATRQR